MSRSRHIGAGAVLGTLALVSVPSVVLAHALGGAVYTLPIPLWLYLAGAAIAVAASFVVTVLRGRSSSGQPHRLRDLSPTLASAGRVVLRNLGIAWWYGAIAVGFVIGDIAREHDLQETSVREWVQRAKTDEGQGPPGALTTAEREELQRLRRENRQLQMEREILKKATAFFAKETT